MGGAVAMKLEDRVDAVENGNMTRNGLDSDVFQIPVLLS